MRQLLDHVTGCVYSVMVYIPKFQQALARQNDFPNNVL